MLGVAIVCENAAIVQTAALQWLQMLTDSIKTAHSIAMPFGMVDQVVPNNHVLGSYVGSRIQIPTWEGAIFADMQLLGRMHSGDTVLPKLLWDFLFKICRKRCIIYAVCCCCCSFIYFLHYVRSVLSATVQSIAC